MSTLSYIFIQLVLIPSLTLIRLMINQKLVFSCECLIQTIVLIRMYEVHDHER